MLTKGESLFIIRRRAKLTQAGMGSQFGLSRFSYGKQEREDTDSWLPSEDINFNQLTDPEKCVILRKRKSLTQYEVSLLLGVSRYWINQKEMGQCDCADLLKHWNANE